MAGITPYLLYLTSIAILGPLQFGLHLVCYPHISCLMPHIPHPKLYSR
jgi:hypothetical protein